MSGPLKLGKVSMSGVSTAMPVLKAGDVVAHLDSWDVRDKKEGKEGQNLVLSWKLDDAWEDINGKKVAAGFPVIANHSMAPSEKNPDWDWRQQVASAIKACQQIEHDKDIPDLDDTVLDACVGKQVILRLKVGKNDMDEARTEIGRYLPIPS